MYVTIARTPGGHLTALQTATDSPPPLPHEAVALHTTRLCPPHQVDRTTGIVYLRGSIATIEPGLADELARVAPEQPTGAVAALLVHRGAGRLVCHRSVRAPRRPGPVVASAPPASRWAASSAYPSR